MNKLKYPLALLAVVAVAACDQQGGQQGEQPAVEEAAALDTTEKRLSYGIAYGLGERLKLDGVPLDVGAFSMGLKDSFEGVEPALTQEEIGAEMQAFQQQRGAEMEQEQQAAASVNAEAGAAFQAANKAKEGVVVLESGLQYRVLTAGEGPMPGADDTVEVNYRGTLVDGSEFDSSYARGSSVSFGVGQVIPGWTEALQLMPAGSKWELVIPPELAYGAGGAGAMIGPNSTLVFEVELIQVQPQPEG